MPGIDCYNWSVKVKEVGKEGRKDKNLLAEEFWKQVGMQHGIFVYSSQPHP